MSSNELFKAAEQLRKDGKFEDAAAKYEEILAADENHVMSLLTLAVVYGKLEQHDKAIASGQRVCELEPNEVFNFTALSVTYKRAFDSTQDPKYIQLAEDALARGHGTGPH
jgi:tetratricopeptide (TPR) repeat protein